MNTEHELPISYVKQFTPLVVGDKYYNKYLKIELTMDQQEVDAFNSGVDHFNTYFLVSFADRPNTGKQPVCDDVVVDVILASGNPPSNNERRVAGGFVWSIWKKSSDIKTWKLNHAALLSKYQSEQGANMNTFTKENTLDATHYYLGSEDYLEHFISGDTRTDISEPNKIGEFEYIELSRPTGERKEDHTIDGVLKKAQPQGAKAYEVALMLEALDNNPDEQIIEPWVADHLKGVGAIAPKPVFTQAMHKDGIMPPIGSKITYHTSPRDEDGVTAAVIGHHNEWMWILTDSGRFDQITMDVGFSFPDNRTDDDKLLEALIWEAGEFNGPRIFNSDKFTITLKE